MKKNTVEREEDQKKPDQKEVQTLTNSYLMVDPNKLNGVLPRLYNFTDYNQFSKPTDDIDISTGLPAPSSAALPDPIINKHIQLPDGNATITALGWAATGEQDSGLSRLGVNDYAYYVNGSLVTEWLSAEFRVNYLTLGSVVFAGTSGKLTQDNSSFFYNSLSPALTYVGSGDYRLHVSNSTVTAQTIYQSIFPSVAFYNLTEAVMEIPAGATVENVAAVAGFISTGDAAPANGVCLFGVGRATANDAAVWGINTLLQDSSSRVVHAGTGRVLVSELDYNVMSPNTQVIGLSVGGNSLAQPTNANGIQVAELGTGFTWTTGFLTQDGSCTTGLSIGMLSTSGATVSSQPFWFSWTDATSTKRVSILQTVSNGFLSLSSTGSFNGFKVASGGVYIDTSYGVVWNGLGSISQDVSGNIAISPEGTFVYTTLARSGSTLTWLNDNSSNTASSHARVSTRVAGSSAGDAFYSAIINGGVTWSWGLYNAGNDDFKISASVSLGTNDRLTMTTSGYTTMTPAVGTTGTSHVFHVFGANNIGGSNGLFKVFAGTSSGQTASTEVKLVDIDLSATMTWAAGAITNERAFAIAAPTLAFASASTVTNAATFYIDRAPQAGSNATITNAYAFWVDDGISRFDAAINGTTLTLSGLTSGRVVFASTSGLLTDDADFTFNSTTNFLTVDGINLVDSSNQVVFQSAGVTGTLTWTPATSNKTVTFQNVTGTVYVSSGTDVTLADGGTNASLAASNGGIVYSDASAMAILAGTATAGQIIRSGSSSAPSWSTATYPATVTANHLLYGTSSNVIGTSSGLTFDGSTFSCGSTAAAGTSVIEVGGAASGNRFAIIDLHGDDTYTDYGLRFIRFDTGANAASQIIHRGTGTFTISTTEAAYITLATTGSDRILISPIGDFIGNDSGSDVDFRWESDDESYCLFVEGTLNNVVLCANAEPGFNSMDGGVYLSNANVVPTGNPSGGGYLYAEGGALKWRGSSGTVTTMAAA